MIQPSHSPNDPPFRPSLRGCVCRDLRMARLLESCRTDALYRATANTCRALVPDADGTPLCTLLEELAFDANEHFRLLGSLISALGGTLGLTARICVDMGLLSTRLESIAALMLEDALMEAKRSIDGYQNALGMTGDRVVRSVLLYLLSDEERHIEQIQKARELL